VTQVIDRTFGTVDSSWGYELPARFLRGEYVGWDFVFTYGPLYQLVHAPVFSSGRDDVASLLRFSSHTVSPQETWLTCLGLWLLLGLSGAPVGWRIPPFLLWVCFGPVLGLCLKHMAGLAVVAGCGQLLDDRWGLTAGRRWVRRIAWAAAAPTLTLYSFDLGVVTSAALLLIGATILVGVRVVPVPPGSRVGRAAAEMMTAVVAGVAVFVLATTLAAGTRPYLADSWEMAWGYSATMAVPLFKRHLLLIAAAAVGNLAVGAFAARQWRHGPGPVGGNGSLGLFAAAGFSLVCLRHALTRSDDLHVLWALSPTFFTVGCLVPCYARTWGLLRSCPAWIAWGPVLVFALWAHLDDLVDRIEAPIKVEWAPARYRLTHPTLRDATAVARELPGDSLYVWPFETILNLTAGKASPAYTLQSYAACTDRLEGRTVDHLRAVPDLPVVVFTDSPAIDRVENLTRTPHIFRYLLEEYVLVENRHKDFVVLRRAPTDPNRPWSEVEIAGLAGAFAPGGNRALGLAVPAGADCRASDLLLLRLHVAKTRTFGVGKPGLLTLTLCLSNGKEISQPVLVPADGVGHDVLVSACKLNDPLFASVFLPARCWRAREGVTAVRLTWDPFDILSRRPSEVVLEGARVLRRAGVEVFETDLVRDGDKALWDWCFRNGPRPDAAR
jgi:hypothetical protein